MTTKIRALAVMMGVFAAAIAVNGQVREWTTYSGDMLGQRHSTLTQITADNVKNLALMDVYGRVARLLLSLAKEQPDGKLVVPERMTQQDIADRVGASRDMISRIFKDLTIGGYVTVIDRQITINRRPPARW